MSPYEQGYEAARKGKSEWSSPYPYNSAEHKQWILGFKRWARNLFSVR